MIRRASILAAAMLLAAAGAASAAAPDGPRLAVAELSGKPARLEVKSVEENGGGALVLAGGRRHARPLPLPFEALSWSPDGGNLAFAGVGGKVAGSKDFILDESQVFLVGADGSDLRAVPGTLEGRRPVFSPDGTKIAFTRSKERKHEDSHGVEHVRYRSHSVWIEDLTTGVVTQLTPWRNGLTIAADSFSPDGAALAATRRRGPKAGSELVALGLDGGGSRVIARNGADGVYSPDGSRIAFLRVHISTHTTGRQGKSATAGIEETSDLFLARADGSDPRRLTKTRGTEIWPSWDPSGHRLVVTRLTGGTEAGFLGFGDSVVEMNADGSCPTTVLTGKRVAFYGATWQPGPGRGADRISC
jgi:Tol biopolymer transport system component